MKQLLALLTSLVALAAVVAGAATPAQKATLTQTNRNCDGSLAGPEIQTPQGFVNFVKSTSNKLVAAVVLKGATANAVYGIRLIQILPQNADCATFDNGPYDGMLATNSSGDGNANVQEAVAQGANSALVVLNNRANPGSDFFTTEKLFF